MHVSARKRVALAVGTQDFYLRLRLSRDRGIVFDEAGRSTLAPHANCNNVLLTVKYNFLTSVRMDIGYTRTAMAQLIFIYVFA